MQRSFEAGHSTPVCQNIQQYVIMEYQSVCLLAEPERVHGVLTTPLQYIEIVGT